MSKLELIQTTDKMMKFWCPGCKEFHVFNNGWNLSGPDDAPTVAPSILVTGGPDPDYRCHSFIRNGQIEFLSDCSHKLAGQTVPMVDIEDLPNEASS